MSVQDIAVQSQPLLNIKDSIKEERVWRVLHRFKFVKLRIEEIHDLENDLTKYFREDLHRRLLSPDFRKQVEGLDMLQKALPSIVKELVEVLDVLLKWFVLRFCESNTTCLLKVLEFLPELFNRLRDDGYSLTKAEASIFLPCLIEKSGHKIEKVREKMRELTKQIVHMYSAAKTFSYIVVGLQSKNNRTQTECAHLVGFLIDNHVAEITRRLQSLLIVASLTADCDGEVREAALNTLATGYKILGEDIWIYSGKLTDAQRSMLDDRFKLKAREMEERREGKPGEATAAMRRSLWENGSDVTEQSGEVARSIPVPVSARENYGYPEVPAIREMMPRASGPYDWNEALDNISFGSPEQSDEGVKVVWHELIRAINDPDGRSMDDLVKDADRLVLSLADKAAKNFDYSVSVASSISCKLALMTLMQMFLSKQLAYAVKEGTLHRLITELLLWLLDERVPRMDDGLLLLKLLNALMLKILDNAERTSSFLVLINLLRNETVAARNQNFLDLVVKCLIRLTKVLQSTIHDVDLDRILESIHIYMQELGKEEMRRRAGAGDLPLRMVKTILHELVKLRGTAIECHLSMVPIDMEPQPIILAYIDLNLQTLSSSQGPSSSFHQAQSNFPLSNAHLNHQFAVTSPVICGGSDRTLRPSMMRSAADNSLAEQLSERFPGGVPSGTLDATRERMKSIQLAAASGNPDPGNRAAAASLYMNGAPPNHDQVMFPNNANSDNNNPTTNTTSMETPLGQGRVLPMDEKALSDLQARMESGTMEPYNGAGKVNGSPVPISRALLLKNMLLAPHISKKLLSVSQFTKDNNVCFILNPSSWRELSQGDYRSFSCLVMVYLILFLLVISVLSIMNPFCPVAVVSLV